MSRTRKTRPIMVKALDPNDRSVGLREVHHHDDGECNLPERPPRKLAHVQEQQAAGQCYYDWDYAGANLCGCHLCTGHEERKAERRKDRKDTKRDLHEGQFLVRDE